nr:MAG TPA: hypothetical protein [Caudoviricetes sp.]
MELRVEVQRLRRGNACLRIASFVRGLPAASF